MKRVKKVLSSNPTTAAFVVYLTYLALLVAIMSMSSCGSSKQFHIGTGKELSKSRCSGNYLNQ